MNWVIFYYMRLRLTEQPCAPTHNPRLDRPAIHQYQEGTSIPPVSGLTSIGIGTDTIIIEGTDSISIGKTGRISIGTDSISIKD
jgi:hypothetical protein